MSLVITIVVAILVFGLVIFFHELGHFIMAKTGGIKVNEFAIGMGPTLFKIQKGETKYALRLFPIGGFVSMEGEDEESEDDRSMQHASIVRRLLVMVAGAVMNLLLGFLALLVITCASPYKIPSRQVAQVDSPASVLKVDDIITKVNGRRAFVYSDLDYEFARTQNGTFNIEVKRDGKKVLLKDVTFEVKTAVDKDTGEAIINDVTGEPYEYLAKGFLVYPKDKTFVSVIGESFNTTLSYARLIYLSLFDLVTGKMPINQLSGPVGIVNEIGKAALMGWQPVVQLLALISINLGVVNMLPLPALDGGRTVLLLIEGVRRKPIPQKYEYAINIGGFALLITLMVLISFNDIRRLIF